MILFKNIIRLKSETWNIKSEGFILGMTIKITKFADWKNYSIILIVNILIKKYNAATMLKKDLKPEFVLSLCEDSDKVTGKLKHEI